MNKQTNIIDFEHEYVIKEIVRLLQNCRPFFCEALLDELREQHQALTDDQPTFEQEKNLSPAMQQWQKFKNGYLGCIMFFRMGDFYETFYEDAEICSCVCGLPLDIRNKDNESIPLAGVPYHAVNGYLKKMLRSGYKVALCEQVESPRTAKGTFKRDMVRILTPGTLSDSTKDDSVEL